MLKIYKNRLFDSLKNIDLHSNNFKIELLEIDHYTEISLINTDLKFQIFNPEDSFDRFNYRFSKFAPNYPLSSITLAHMITLNLIKFIRQ